MKCSSCGSDLHCRHCGSAIDDGVAVRATRKQAEAYRLVHVHGLTQDAAAEMLGITQQSLCGRLSLLRIKLPELFFSENPTGTAKTVSLCPGMDNKIRRKF